MTFFESLLALLAVAVLLLQVSRRVAIPYPTMLAGAGTLAAAAPPPRVGPTGFQRMSSSTLVLASALGSSPASARSSPRRPRHFATLHVPWRNPCGNTPPPQSTDDRCRAAPRPP